MGLSIGSLLPTTQTAPHDMVPVTPQVQSIVVSSTNKKISSLLNDIDSFANSDAFSKCEAMRREDGSLKITVTAKDWDQGAIGETEGEIIINATRKYDQSGSQFIFIEVKRFIKNTEEGSNDLAEQNTITINSAGKVKTSFSADRKFEVLNGIDALKSTVRRLLELEMYKNRGVLDNVEDSTPVLNKLHVYDNFDPSKNPNNLSEEQWKDMERQLGDINKILQMVE